MAAAGGVTEHTWWTAGKSKRKSVLQAAKRVRAAVAAGDTVDAEMEPAS